MYSSYHLLLYGASFSSFIIFLHWIFPFYPSLIHIFISQRYLSHFLLSLSSTLCMFWYFFFLFQFHQVFHDPLCTFNQDRSSHFAQLITTATWTGIWFDHRHVNSLLTGAIFYNPFMSFHILCFFLSHNFCAHWIFNELFFKVLLLYLKVSLVWWSDHFKMGPGAHALILYFGTT